MRENLEAIWSDFSALSLAVLLGQGILKGGVSLYG
jgi:hypothetical protein